MELDKEIIVALIAAAGAIIVAFINLVGNKKKFTGKSERDIKINQKAKGESITQIGIQVNSEKEDESSGR